MACFNYSNKLILTNFVPTKNTSAKTNRWFWSTITILWNFHATFWQGILNLALFSNKATFCLNGGVGLRYCSHANHHWVQTVPIQSTLNVKTWEDIQNNRLMETYIFNGNSENSLSKCCIIISQNCNRWSKSSVRF